MTPDSPSPSRDALSPQPTGWVVGEPASRPPAGPSAADQRSARLGARLEVYSRYGALVAEEAAAVLRGDVARVEALEGERAALAEHFEELRAAESAVDGRDFREALADALAETDHQVAVDLTLRRELTRVAEGLRALPAPAEPAVSAPAPDAEGAPTVAGAVNALAGALIDARSQGVGGALSGYFPGIAGGVGGAEVVLLYGEDGGREGKDGSHGAAEGARLDVRF